MPKMIVSTELKKINTIQQINLMPELPWRKNFYNIIVK